MNQEQRRFLISQVQSTCDEQVRRLEKELPVKPSLNNYLIAAFLDNSIQFADIEAMKIKMRETVLKFGTSDKLVYEERNYWNRGSEDEECKVHIQADDLFVIPQSYKDALAEYEAKKTEIEDKVRQLKATTNTIIMKIQIGSSATMDKLVMQIDSMGDLNLVNSQLALQ